MKTLIDTGPLVALADRADAHHARCRWLLERLPAPLLLPSTVLIEACSLINSRTGAGLHATFLDGLVRDLDARTYELVEITSDDVRRMAELVRQYRDLRLDPTDASVITLAERLGVTQVATLDRRDFTVVRPKHVPALTLLPE